jgi:uncharacterized protein YwgA
VNTEVFAAFLIDILEEIKGKKAFQKLVYFGQVLGVPLNHSYKMYYYGPYSETVAEELTLALNNGIIAKNGAFSFIYGDNLEKVLNDGYDQIADNIKNLEKLIELFGDMSPYDLELYATTHFIDKSQKYLYNNHDKDSIIDIVQKVKGDKFTKNQIDSAYNTLVKWNLLS